MKLFTSLIQQSWFEGLPVALMPYGDEDKITEYFKSSDLASKLSSSDFLFFIGKRMYIEWCLEQESKGVDTDHGRKFDYRVYEKFIADESQYEFERSTLPDERSNRGTFYEVRLRVLEAFVKNAVSFLQENKGIDGVSGNRRNLRCDLSSYLDKRRQQPSQKSLI